MQERNAPPPINIGRAGLPELPANWHWVRFEDVCKRVSVGHVGPTTKYFSERADGIVFLRSQNVRPGRLDLESAAAITPEFHRQLKKSQLRPGDILFVRVGANRGDCCVVPEGIGEINCANIVFARPNHPTGFHAYFFQSDLGRSLLLSASVGAAQGVINTSSVASMPVPYPPLPIQRRIAGILSAYDELIENSQRRIRILETMARALYREWFVHFRFPGHEGHPRVASALGEIPAGWEVVDLASVCIKGNGIQTGPFGSQLHAYDYSEEGVPVVMPKDLIDFRIRTDSIARIPEETANRLARHRMQTGDIVYGRRGDIGRRAYVMPHQTGWLCGSGSLRFRPDLRVVNGWYLFNYLGQDDVVGLIAGRAQGVTMPNLSAGVMASIPVTLPPRHIQDRFEHLTFPFAEAREILTDKIQNLRRTRDLLLPRLLAGQIDVEAAQ